VDVSASVANGRSGMLSAYHAGGRAMRGGGV